MKKLKRLMAAVLVGATILSFAGCSKAKDVKNDKDVEEEQEEQDIPDIYDEDTFFDALENPKRDLLLFASDGYGHRTVMHLLNIFFHLS